MELWIKFGQGILLVFSINDYESFEKIKRTYDNIVRIKQNQNCPILLIGNKIDLENERVVSYSEAKELAESWRIEYCEVSTRNDFNYQKILENILKKFIDNQRDIIRPNPVPICCLFCAYLCYNIWYYLCCCFLFHRR